MDTRAKIVPALPADSGSARLVAGYFDPLYAAHVRWLREVCTPEKRNIVIILDPPDPLLPARARAELVASLAFVDAVVEGGPVPEGAIDATAADGARSRDLANHVVRRHRSA